MQRNVTEAKVKLSFLHGLRNRSSTKALAHTKRGTNGVRCAGVFRCLFLEGGVGWLLFLHWPEVSHQDGWPQFRSESVNKKCALKKDIWKGYFSIFGRGWYKGKSQCLWLNERIANSLSEDSVRLTGRDSDISQFLFTDIFFCAFPGIGFKGYWRRSAWCKRPTFALKCRHVRFVCRFLGVCEVPSSSVLHGNRPWGKSNHVEGGISCWNGPRETCTCAC